MSSAVSTEPTSEVAARSQGDSFLLGLSVMLIVNMLQRLIGLVRNISFCQVLTDDALGHWAMANSFFIIGAPLVVLGLPGAFGKFVEVYRLRGQLGNYLRMTGMISAVGMGTAAGMMILNPEFFSWLVFNETGSMSVIFWLAVTLFSVTCFNTVNELVSALREVRVVSIMQFVNSVGFAILGGVALSMNPSWIVLLPAYSLACILGVLPGIWVIWIRRNLLNNQGPTLDIREIGTRVLPFAAILWCNNLLTNLFELADRYMLLHLSPGGAEVGQALAGQYHCSRIIPNLLTSLAMLMCGILLPYLSADWEQGKKDRVEQRLNGSLQFVAVGFTLVSIAALLVAPWLFNYYLVGRYSAAQSIMPQVLLQCIWLSLFLVAQAYLFCIERGRQIIWIQLLGLGLNLTLNYFLIRHWALAGAVTSTSIAYGVVIAMMIWRMSREGTRLGWNTTLICFVPATLVLGPIAASAAIGLLIVIASRTDWIFDDEDRARVDQFILPKLARFGLRLNTLW
ncbi:MAG: lipopolysaccharide biosynthesis protein [Pirellulales bacterium]